MIIKNLTLVNFRKFKNASIEFPDGVTGVIGLNGAGKSTIFEAIAWVLYGPTAARTSAEQVKRQGAEHSEQCRVELEFEFENDCYRVVRSMAGKSMTAQATATMNGKVAATSAESVTRFIQKKLGLDFKSFFTSIFARQKELNALSTMNASDRRPLILRMLGIDSLDEIIKEIRDDKRNKDKLIERLSNDILDESGKSKDLVFKEKIKDTKSETQKLNNELKNISEQIKKDKIKQEKLSKSLVDFKKQYESLIKEKETLAEKKTQFEVKEKLENEIRQLTRRTDERKKNIAKEKKSLESYKSVENDIKLTNDKLKTSQKNLEQLIKEIEKRNTLIQRNKIDIKELERKKKNIEKIGSEAECPTCERTLADQYNVLIKRFEKDIKEKTLEVENFEKEKTKHAGNKEKIIREKSALEKKKNYLETQNRKKAQIDVILKQLNSELDSELKIINEKKTEIKKIKVTTFDKKTFEKVKKQVDEFYIKYQDAQKLYDSKKDDISKTNISFEKIQGELKLKESEIKNLQDKIEGIEETKKQIQGGKNTIRYLAVLSDVMNDFRIFLISRIRPTLSTYASDFFNRLTDGKYPEMELDEKYDLLVYDNGELYNINRFSGGEEDLANLCLRLAISEVITERAGGVFNFIILDEIFGSQDSIRRQNIMKALCGLSSKFRQIFLITHVDDVKNDMENILYVSEDEQGFSTIKVE